MFGGPQSDRPNPLQRHHKTTAVPGRFRHMQKALKEQGRTCEVAPGALGPDNWPRAPVKHAHISDGLVRRRLNQGDRAPT